MTRERTHETTEAAKIRNVPIGIGRRSLAPLASILQVPAGSLWLRRTVSPSGLDPARVVPAAAAPERDRQNIAVHFPGDTLRSLDVSAHKRTEGQLAIAQARHVPSSSLTPSATASPFAVLRSRYPCGCVGSSRTSRRRVHPLREF